MKFPDERVAVTGRRGTEVRRNAPTAIGILLRRFLPPVFEMITHAAASRKTCPVFSVPAIRLWEKNAKTKNFLGEKA